MALQLIDLTTPQPGGKFGDPTKTAWEKANDNFIQLQTGVENVQSGADAGAEALPRVLALETELEEEYPRKLVLADALGSEMVGYRNPVVGSGSRTIAAKASDQISALDIPGVVADGVTDISTALNSAIQSLPEGTTIRFPDGVYICRSKIVLDRLIHLAGYSTCSFFTVTGAGRGARLHFPPEVMSGIPVGVEISADWVKLISLMVSSSGYQSGSSGVRTVGASNNYCHGVGLDHCSVFGFETGLTVGEFTDHPSVHRSYLSGNDRGMAIEPNNHHDIYLEDSYLDSNRVGGVFIHSGAYTQNFVAVRTHFGFAQKGIYMDPSATAGGVDGLTLIGCPMESISQTAVDVFEMSNVRIMGGYAIWNGTPTTPFIRARRINGPVYIEMKFQGANPNCPYLIQAVEYSNHPVKIVGALGTFAQALKSPNLYRINLTPALPLSFSAYTNNLGYDVMVYVSGGTVSQIVVGSPGAFVSTGITSGGVLVRNGDSIRLTYSAAPTWAWVYAY